ncbi:ribosomal protein S15 [Plasmodium falciparum Santa Lucia]|uniref:Apicoplast ribosomal protein S15, putative n=8 Tax=Plasmodium falciparum TaxID=5833 RepID=Q8IIU2_PLAF7|nr:apicoplast ribosomal protein S15 precursor, putative [Plasmodium falciparum 3D7]ETW17934.1 ribosomal protein S15 [Plasmodium falciparum Vietnam Oak-Knoll (FVO)]ETW42299.1 ribosomal protein S15 [Plasmodium falciparum NF135/5.C10]ETW52683.1 ribosomal protein S15 [Plasmodium falciparum Palo Alto/Uganda]ETW60893.1 ribosomal protein S15 [Plasmodium falciparum CAMP/Malaysia]EUR70660.1 ribosomal protein S15 [Plasmodium falciparum 7G8]EUT84058.1 ribosomal protein S15 [Plasmodium falciparum Santa L|eukprot:XP_001347748.1 apicoplast ribosomal protein S15 precursor,putative [Plasmodium falciparum 3D7]
MKNIKSCVTCLLFFYIQIWINCLFCFGYNINKNLGVYPFSLIRKKNVPQEKFKRQLIKVQNEGKENIFTQDGNTNTIKEDKTKQTKTNIDIKNKIEKEKIEINEILKKSENILLERSFSFHKEDITIKPELLKELITQKYRKIFQRHDKDCGSSEIQIIILTFKIFFLTEHMKKNKKDFACLRGLFKCVSKRRRLLVYLGRKDREMFEKITSYFNIKKPLLPRTPEYYNKDLKYIHFNNTKRFKNNAEKKKKDKLKKKKVQTDKILFGN